MAIRKQRPAGAGDVGRQVPLCHIASVLLRPAGGIPAGQLESSSQQGRRHGEEATAVSLSGCIHQTAMKRQSCRRAAWIH